MLYHSIRTHDALGSLLNICESEQRGIFMINHIQTSPCPAPRLPVSCLYNNFIRPWKVGSVNPSNHFETFTKIYYLYLIIVASSRHRLINTFPSSMMPADEWLGLLAGGNGYLSLNTLNRFTFPAKSFSLTTILV